MSIKSRRAGGRNFKNDRLPLILPASLKKVKGGNGLSSSEDAEMRFFRSFQYFRIRLFLNARKGTKTLRKPEKPGMHPDANFTKKRRTSSFSLHYFVSMSFFAAPQDAVHRLGTFGYVHGVHVLERNLTP